MNQYEFPPPPPGIGVFNGSGQTYGEILRSGEAKPKVDTINWQYPFPIDPTMIPVRPWLIKNLLLRRQITLLVAPPGSGKSLLTLQAGMICAAEKEWNGWKPRGSYRVLIINSEEDYDEQQRRLWAAASIMGIPQEQLTKNFALAVNPETIVIAKVDRKTKTVIREPMLEKIKKTIIDGQFDIVIVDPFAETFIGDENDNSELKWCGVLWREVARSTDAAVLLVHHSKKYAGQMAGDMDAARGGGSLLGIARIVCTLFSMTEEDAAKFDLEAESAERKMSKEEMRSRLLRFDDAKSNQALVIASPLSKCLFKETVRLNNGNDKEDGDEVGVLVPFIAKTKIGRLLQNSEHANRILDDLQDGVKDDEGRPIGQPFLATPKRGPKPKQWAGTIIQEHIQCSAQEASEILDVWIKNKVIESVQAKIDRKHGGLSECLRVMNCNRPGSAL